jgi:hypothetical protein
MLQWGQLTAPDDTNRKPISSRDRSPSRFFSHVHSPSGANVLHVARYVPPVHQFASLPDLLQAFGPFQDNVIRVSAVSVGLIFLLESSPFRSVPNVWVAVVSRRHRLFKIVRPGSGNDHHW